MGFNSGFKGLNKKPQMLKLNLKRIIMAQYGLDSSACHREQCQPLGKKRSGSKKKCRIIRPSKELSDSQKRFGCTE